MATLPTTPAAGNLAVSDDVYVSFDANSTQTIATAWSTVYPDSFSVASQEIDPRGIAFSSDGTKMYVVGFTNDTVYQYTLSTAWDVSTASYASKSLSIGTQDGLPAALFFSSDGTKMYFVGRTNTTVYQYTLSTAWDISSGSYASKSLSVESQETTPFGVAFSSDGTKMYVVGLTNDTVYQYTLSTAWDVSTASYASKSLSVASQQTAPRSMSFSGDGTKMYVAGTTPMSVFQYTLSTAWDVSTGSYASKSLPITPSESELGSAFSADGTKMYVVGVTNDTVYQYALSTAWDISTGSISSTGAWPSDLDTIDTLSWEIENSRSAAGGDDTLALAIRVVRGSTILAAADSGGAFATVRNVTGNTDITNGPTAFAYVNTGAAASLWNSASVELRQTFTVNMGSDGHFIRVDYVAFTGTYTTSGPTSHPVTASGSTVTDGTANVRAVRPVAASGATVTDGTAFIEIAVGGEAHPVTASGATTTDGTASISRSHPVTADGATTTDGTATVNTTRPMSASGATSTDGTADIELAGAPTVPQNLTATTISDTEIDLAWDAFIGALAYDIERNGSLIVAGHNTNTYNDTGLSSSTLYEYRVRAVV